MEEEVIELTGADFEGEIAKGNWIVDFWAAWCAPCRMMAPHFAEAAGKTKKAKFAKLNIEENQELAQQFEIMSIPCLLYFKDGKEVDRTLGLMDSKRILDKIESVF